MPSTQFGLGFSNFLLWAFVLVIVGIVVLRLVPAYVEDAQIEKIFVTISKDPEMQRANVSDIRSSYVKRALIENITAIRAEDIKVANPGGRLVLSASYDVKLPLAGNVSLYLEFNPSSAK